MSGPPLVAGPGALPPIWARQLRGILAIAERLAGIQVFAEQVHVFPLYVCMCKYKLDTFVWAMCMCISLMLVLGMEMQQSSLRFKIDQI